MAHGTRASEVRIDMNMFRAFESRIAEAFGASQQGIVAPFSFRKLAKRATREMEQETYVVDGVNTAPALITILADAELAVQSFPYGTRGLVFFAHSFSISCLATDSPSIFKSL